MSRLRKSQGKYGKKPIKWKKPGGGKKSVGAVDKKRKNYRFIQRGKEMVETHLKQKLTEDKYREQARSTVYNEETAFENFNDVEDEEENPFDELLTALDAGKSKKEVKIEESDSEESDNEDEASDMEAEELDAEGDEEEEEVNSSDEDETNDMEDEELGEEEEVADSSDEDAENTDQEMIDKPIAKNDETNEDDEDDEEDEIDDEEDEEDEEEQSGKEKLNVNTAKLNLIDADETQAYQANKNDTFSRHLDFELTAKHVENLLATPTKMLKKCLQWPAMGMLTMEIPLKEEQQCDTEDQEPCIKSLLKESDLKEIGIKAAIIKNISEPLTVLQTELFAVLNNYQDLFYAQRNFEQAEELRMTYCLHALNHMLKTRSRITHHNAKIQAATKKSKSAFIVPDNYRDQGLVRPKVLIILPTRDAAYRVVNLLAQLLYGDQMEASKKNGTIINYERFSNDYTGNTLHFPKTNPKPEDYEQLFSGNTDDNFRIGISLTKKCLKLYTDFYGSDILIASPLGLRMVIGAQGSHERDYDFLNSIELLIIDQAELLLAQNWENLLHVLEHMHLQPQSLRDADFQRVRPWCLSGHTQFYRQTVLLSSHELPEFRALFNNKCYNYRGKVRLCNPILNAVIRSVIVPVTQRFQRIAVNNLETSFDERFNYFIHEVLPRFRQPSFAHCMIYVPSYFDYVRLRNYFKAETINFVQICEYTKKEKIARARDMFYHSGAHFLLYSERAHFFRRTRIKGIRHIIMYQPPQWPHFYAELINFMQSANQNSHDGLQDSMSITILYTKYDVLQLNGILGSETAKTLMQSAKTAHAFASE